MYPVRYEADFAEQQSRAKAFFRWVLIIPWAILGGIYALAAQVVALLAWFALLFTGRYPQGLYDFQAGYLRFSGRLLGYGYLQTEEWPPFGFERDPAYPVRVEVDPPLERYNRWKVAFRLILAFPVYVMLYLIPYLALLGAMAAWLHIVFMGRTSGGIHNAITVGNAYALRSVAYLLLVTETLPPVSDQAPAGNVAGPGPAAASKQLPPSSAPKPKASPKRAKKAAARKAPSGMASAKGSAAARRSAKQTAARRKPAAGS